MLVGTTAGGPVHVSDHKAEHDEGNDDTG